MIKAILLSGAILASANLFAAPTQLSIVGIIPDVSTKDDVAKVGSGSAIKTFNIGGVNLYCTDEYIDDKLSDFFCLLKKGGDNQPLNNNQVYSILKSGFTKKFGIPTKTEKSTVQNAYGAKFDEHRVTWRDKKGNKLSITNMLGSIDTGALTMYSATKLKQDKENVVEAKF